MAMYHSSYAELTANVSSACYQTDWAMRSAMTTARPLDDPVRSSESSWGSYGRGTAKSPSVRLRRPSFGLAAASLTAAAVPQSTHGQTNRVIALPLVGLGDHERLSDNAIAWLSIFLAETRVAIGGASASPRLRKRPRLIRSTLRWPLVAPSACHRPRITRPSLTAPGLGSRRFSYRSTTNANTA